MAVRPPKLSRTKSPTPGAKPDQLAVVSTTPEPVILAEPGPVSEDSIILQAPPAALRNRLLTDPSRREVKPAFTRQEIEAVVIARGGGVMIVGWINDVDHPIDAVTVSCAGWRVCFDAQALIRVRRLDVESALPGNPNHLFGFFGLIAAPGLDEIEESALIDIQLSNGGHVTIEVPTQITTSSDLRNETLGYLANAAFFGNPHVEAVSCLEPGAGSQFVAFNQNITRRIVAGRHVERFGKPRRQPKGSIVVCLYGRAEYLFVQNALFAGQPGIEDYEFIFVLNSPEIAEEVMREAHLAHRIYRLNQTVVLLPGNAGFGAANNIGVLAALGRRILNINPDVFPRQADWAQRHIDLVEALPAEQTRLFGVPLYYDDGSLMHGGMYLELDSVASIQAGAIDRRRLLRVEHYGKGSPNWVTSYTRPRPVPAVTGAFISTDRAWYEKLGGFNEDYIFGHYEDADLCLKSLEQGIPAWLHDLRLWHLEGKGSTRKPYHEGGSLVNRWLFTKRWLPMASAGLLGPNPTHPALVQPE